LGTGWDESEEVCGTRYELPPAAPSDSTALTLVIAIAIVLSVLCIAVAWYYYVRRKGSLSAEDSANPLNPATTMTTLPTGAK